MPNLGANAKRGNKVKFGNKVTMIMTTYNNFDFTSVCCVVFRRYYPDVKIILADGGSTDRTLTDYKDFAEQLVYIPEGYIEDCRNTAAVLVDTPYLLTMDNDVKIIGKDALPLLYEVFEKYPDAAQTAAYCVKVANFKEKRGYCSDIFDGNMEVDWCPAYFSLHKTEAWRKVYGQPKEYYYGDPPFERGIEKQYNNGGDASISKYYQRVGYKIYSPKEKVPVLHFVGAAWWSTDMRTSDWWAKNHTHIRVNPLNDWRKNENK